MLYHKVLVNIIIKRSSTLVYIEVYSRKGIIATAHNEFATTKPNEKMIEFITTYTRESPYFYISLLDNSSQQGALPTCQKSKLSIYYDLSDSEYKCYNEKWAYYTAKEQLYAIKKLYEPIGIDFIFSPFVVLANFFQDKINATLALYILIEENFVSLSVFENGNLLYAQHLDMQRESDEDISLSDATISDETDSDTFGLDTADDGVDLESIDVDDDIGDLEDFSDIEDLDSIEDIEEFNDSKDAEEEFLESDSNLTDADDEDFNEDYQRFSLIQSSIANYYKDERYESQFLENVYIADSVGVHRDLKKYLEEEMFLNVYIRKMELDVELSALAKEELDL